MEAVFSWVKNIVVFFLVLTLIEEVLPDSDYKKYIRAAAGMVFILIVFSPLLSVFQMEGTMDYYFQWESFKSAFLPENERILDGFDTDNVNAQKEALVIGQYKENLKEQIRVLVENEGYRMADVSVTVNESADSEAFGSVEGIHLILGSAVKETLEEGEEISPDTQTADIDAIAPVCIGKDTGERKEESGEHGDYTELLEVLSGNYGIPVNQITITVEHSR